MVLLNWYRKPNKGWNCKDCNCNLKVEELEKACSGNRFNLSSY